MFYLFYIFNILIVFKFNILSISRFRLIVSNRQPILSYLILVYDIILNFILLNKYQIINLSTTKV
jgi:hypothetical protein